MLKRTNKDQAWALALLDALEVVRDADPKGYAERVRPHLHGAEIPSPVCTLSSLEALERASGLLPFASYGLDLSVQRLEPKEVLQLVASPASAQLTSLNLCENNLGETGAQAIAGSPHMAQLTSFNLEGNEIGEQGAQALAQSRYSRESSNS